MDFVAPDAWNRSTTTEEVLEKLIADGLLVRRSDPTRPEWIAPRATEEEPNPPAGYIVSFVGFHEWGFGMPASRFMRALPHYYGVELQHFGPNSIMQAAIYAAVCEGYLGIPPHWDLWVYLFRAEFFTLAGAVRGTRKLVRAGSCVLQVRHEKMPEYIPAKLPTNTRDWDDGWFYLRNDGNHLPAYTGKVLSEKPEKWRYGLVTERKHMVAPLLEALGKLRSAGLTAAVVVAAFQERRVLPLMKRRRPSYYQVL